MSSPSSDIAVTALAELIARHARPESASWFAARLGAQARADFDSAFAGAGRRLGTAATALGDHAAALGEAAILVEGRGLDEIGRVALIADRLARIPHGEHVALINDLYYRGTEREKQAVLRALPLLPEPARFLEVAVEAPRANVMTVFEAICCENPYPADHFPELTFNQMVLKALFNAVRVSRIVSLERRAEPDLVRMVEGYASERRAAGRAVPEDIALIVDLAASHQAKRSAK